MDRVRESKQKYLNMMVPMVTVHLEQTYMYRVQDLKTAIYKMLPNTILRRLEVSTLDLLISHTASTKQSILNVVDDNVSV